MQNAEELSPGQISEFLKASYGIESSGQNRAERYAWTQRVLIAQEYASQGKKQRGQIRGYISKISGLSMPQVARLIRMYRASGKVEAKVYWRRQFDRKYTTADVALLAAVDRAHERLSRSIIRGRPDVRRNCAILYKTDIPGPTSSFSVRGCLKSCS